MCKLGIHLLENKGEGETSSRPEEYLASTFSSHLSLFDINTDICLIDDTNSCTTLLVHYFSLRRIVPQLMYFNYSWLNGFGPVWYLTKRRKIYNIAVVLYCWSLLKTPAWYISNAKVWSNWSWTCYLLKIKIIMELLWRNAEAWQS